MNYKSIERSSQLVNELFVSNLNNSLQFYNSLGFTTQRADDHFAVLRWEDSLLFLDERQIENRPPHAGMNIRIIVPDVDNYWNQTQQMGYTVFQPISDKYYGLRDFTILDPDGFGVRFGSYI
ncbi:MAG: VOC family protein [Bacteroidetes bacterium]|nr:VOC family protein [Bacteroidota bacterium]